MLAHWTFLIPWNYLTIQARQGCPPPSNYILTWEFIDVFLKDKSIVKAKRLEEEAKALKIKEEEDAKSKIREEERLKEETQRRAIQDALNKQTFQPFKCYAEQQYPGIFFY